MIAWFASNPVAANLLMAIIVVTGLWSVSERIPLEVFPEFERDTVTIDVSYRGATPAEVEEAVLVRIEESIADLLGGSKKSRQQHVKATARFESMFKMAMNPENFWMILKTVLTRSTPSRLMLKHPAIKFYNSAAKLYR